MGIVYDDCRQAILGITPDFEGGCATFIKEYTPTDADARCAAFSITINVEIVKKATSTLAAPICGSPITSESTTDPGQATDIVTYQWQEDPTSSGVFADIPGATSATYTPTTAPVTTQCFRLITTTTGACVDSDNAICSDTSNVEKFTIDCTDPCEEADCGAFPANPAGN